MHCASWDGIIRTYKIWMHYPNMERDSPLGALRPELQSRAKNDQLTITYSDTPISLMGTGRLTRKQLTARSGVLGNRLGKLRKEVRKGLRSEAWKRKKFSRLKADQQHLEENVERIGKRVTRLGKADSETGKRLKKLKKTTEFLHRSGQQQEQRIDILDARYGVFRKACRKFKKSDLDQDKQIKDLGKSDRKLLRRTGQLKQRVKTLDQSHEQINQNLTALERTTSGLVESQHRIKQGWLDLHAQIEDLAKRFGELGSAPEAPENTTALQELHERIALLERKADDYLDQLKELKSGFDAMRVEVTDHDDELQKLFEQPEPGGTDEETAQFKEQLQKVEGDTLDLSCRLDDFEAKTGSLLQRTAELEETADTLYERTLRLDRLIEDLAEVKEQLAAADKAAGVPHAQEPSGAASAEQQERLDGITQVLHGLEERIAGYSTQASVLAGDQAAHTERLGQAETAIGRIETQSQELSGRVQDLLDRVAEFASLSTDAKAEDAGESGIQPEKGYDELDARIQGLDRQLGSHKERLESETERLSSNISNLNDRLKDLADQTPGIAGALSAQGEITSSEHRRIDELAVKLQELATQVSGQDRKLASECERLGSSINGLLERLASLTEQITAIPGSASTLQAEVSNDQQRIEELDHRTETLNQQVVDQERKLATETERFTASIRELIGEVETLSSSLRGVPEAVNSLEIDVSNDRRRIDELDTKTQSLDQQLGSQGQKLDTETERLSASIRELIAGVERLSSAMRGLPEAVTALGDKAKADRARIDGLDQSVVDLQDADQRQAARSDEIQVQFQGLEHEMSAQGEQLKDLETAHNELSQKRKELALLAGEQTDSIDKLSRDIRGLEIQQDQQQARILKLSSWTRRQSVVGSIAAAILLLALLLGFNSMLERVDEGDKVSAEKIQAIENRVSAIPNLGEQQEIMATLTELRSQIEQIQSRVEQQEKAVPAAIGTEEGEQVSRRLSEQMAQLQGQVDENRAKIAEISDRMQEMTTDLDGRLSALQIKAIALEFKPPVVVENNKITVWEAARKHNLYSIQLIALLNKRSMLDFIEENDLYENAAYLQSVQQGQKWYILLYGIYANYNEAKAALETLAPELKVNGAWVRPLGELGQATPL